MADTMFAREQTVRKWTPPKRGEMRKKKGVVFADSWERCNFTSVTKKDRVR